MKTKSAFLALSAMLLIGFATASEAKGFGGGKSSGVSTATAKKTGNKEDVLPEAKDKAEINIRLPSVSAGSGASASSTAMSAGTAALGATAGAAVAKTLSPEEVRKANDERAQEEQRELKAAEERKAREAAEEARKKEERERLAAIAAAAREEREKREAQAAERRAQIEKEKEIERQRQARLNQCAFKPVMTDAEMAICREVLR